MNLSEDLVERFMYILGNLNSIYFHIKPDNSVEPDEYTFIFVLKGLLCFN